MSHEDMTPQSLQDVWNWATERFKAHDAAHMDAILMQMGDRAVENPPRSLNPQDQMVLEAWQSASPEERHHLTHLFMRTVGHQEFPQE